MRIALVSIMTWAALAVAGCHAPEITAVALSPQNRGEPEGIPFYLPKPLLVVAKNFRSIEDAKVGLTDSAPIPVGFDDQSKYADVNSRASFVNSTTAAGAGGGGGGDGGGGGSADGQAATSQPRLFSANGAPMTPKEAPSDGLSPNTFYTYQIIFVPDLSQKYGLKIKGGAGEVRAAMNLVNGWQFTGLGPYYMKDSSTAQNILASGITANLAASGVSDVISNLADLSGKLQSGETVEAGSPQVVSLTKSMASLESKGLSHEPMCIPNFAEIHVYEPTLTFDCQMEWREIVCLNFTREYLGVENVQADFAKPQQVSPASGQIQSGMVRSDEQLGRLAAAKVLGIPTNSPALLPPGSVLQAGEVGGSGSAAAPAMTQVQVDCGDGDKCRPHEFNLFNFAHGLKHHRKTRRPKHETRTVLAAPGVVTLPDAVVPAATQTPSTAAPPGQGIQSGETSPLQEGTILQRPILNQPTLNQPTLNPPQTLPIE